MLRAEGHPCQRMRTHHRIGFTGGVDGSSGLWSAFVAAAGIGVGIHRVFFPGPAHYPWPPEPCVVQGVSARCGTFIVPENRAKPHGRTIGLHVVVLPAFAQPARKDAVACLVGGPGVAATEQAADLDRQLVSLNRIATSCSWTSAAPAARPGRTATRPSTGRGWRWTTSTLCASRARLPAARADRRLLRRDRRADLPEAPSILGAHAHALRRVRDQTSPSSTATPPTPSAPSTSSRGSAPPTPAAARRFRAGSAVRRSS